MLRESQVAVRVKSVCMIWVIGTVADQRLTQVYCYVSFDGAVTPIATHSFSSLCPTSLFPLHHPSISHQCSIYSSAKLYSRETETYQQSRPP